MKYNISESVSGMDFEDYFIDNHEPPIRKSRTRKKDVVCKWCGKKNLIWHDDYDHTNNKVIWELYEIDQMNKHRIFKHVCNERNQ